MEEKKQLSQVVEKMQEYIKEHLLSKLTSYEIAKAVNYSQFHAARIFKEETGLSPFEYIRKERLLGAAFALRKEKAKVVDVALDFVFDSQEGFTRAFTNGFGISPKRFARQKEDEGFLIPFRYLDRQKTKTEETIMDTKVVFTQIMDRPARKLILFRSKKAEEYYAYCEEVGCGTPEKPAPWDILCGIKEALYEPVGVWLPDNMRPEGTGIYAHAVEVPIDFKGTVPEGFDIIDLPACQYLIFQGEPYNDEECEKGVGEAWDAIAKYNPEVYGYTYFNEAGPRFQLAPLGWRGYIEGRPVKKIAK